MSQIVVLQDREEVLKHIRKVQESFHIKAPDLPEHYKWFNVGRPVTPHDLRGKVVLLDFWTYCCINCMHILPDLKYLEEKYANQPFVVVGVHSGKFTNEREIENVRQAILRNEIEHPVVIDQNFALWSSYAVHSWPTLVLIDPEGNIEAVFSGEGNREIIDLYIELMLEEYAKISGPLNASPTPIKLEREKRSSSTFLKYPGKILVDADRKLLVISDTGNHRIVITDLSGEVKYVIGNARPGLSNGNFQSASFNNPQGLAFYKGNLLVADTGNHAIRQVDFKVGQVRTLAGTGQQGHYLRASGYGPEIPISSPWDLQVVGEKCFIAMAGVHQVWALDLELLTIEAYAGTGQEARVDGARKNSAFAQPSGITSDPEGKFLYIADSEVSSVRVIDLHKNGPVSTLVGGDLFEFGDKDGSGLNVRLQHPLDIHFLDEKLYLADTYNHKIKTVDPKTSQTRSYLGTGKPGAKDGLTPQFYEPGGLSSFDHKLYIADTNNHAIRVIDLFTHRTSTLEISRPGLASHLESENQVLAVSKIVQEKLQHVSSDFTLRTRILLPNKNHFTPDASFHYLLLGDQEVFHSQIINKIQSPSKPLHQLEIPIKTTHPRGKHQLRLQLQYLYCSKTGAESCKIRTVEHQIPIEITSSGQTEIIIQDLAK